MRLFSSVPLRHVHEKRQSPQETVSKSLEWNVVSEIQIAEIILKPDLSFAPSCPNYGFEFRVTTYMPEL